MTESCVHASTRRRLAVARLAVARLGVAGLVVGGLVGCTGGTGEPVATSPTVLASDDAVSPPVTSLPETSLGTSPSVSPPTRAASPTPSPSPTPAPTAGVGTIRLDVADEPVVEEPVLGDCVLAGDGLPDDGTGDALVDDVEILVGVDNFGARPGQSIDEQPVAPVVVRVDGAATEGVVELDGGPVDDWQWWAGDLRRFELADPVLVDGVEVVTATFAARLGRDDRTDLGGPAPQPSPKKPKAPKTSDGGGDGQAAAGFRSDEPSSRAGDLPMTRPVVQPASPGAVGRIRLRLEVACTVVR